MADQETVKVVREAIERAERYERTAVGLLPELRTTRIAMTVIYALEQRG